VVRASSTIEECSPLVEIPPCRPSCWRYIREVQRTSPYSPTMPWRLCCLGNQRTQEILPSRVCGECYLYQLEQAVDPHEVSGPYLISIQMANQCPIHHLKGPHYPNHITHSYLFLPNNLFISLRVRPLSYGCYLGHHGSSPSTLLSASMASSSHEYLHEYKST
jgi:hypothetical protein